MIYEFDPRKERFAIEIGLPNKLERLDKIPRPRPDEEVAMCINWNVFDWVKNFNGYGEIEQDGKQIQAPSGTYKSMSFKDGKLTYGDVQGAQVGAGVAITLVIDGVMDIRNPAKMSIGKDHRTAVGQKINGNIVFVTLDNVTTTELALYMIKRGCIVAFQGDCGGSTGYYDGVELYDQGRAIAGALVVYKKAAERLICLDDGHSPETPGKRTPFFPGTKQFMHENEFNEVVTGYLKIDLERCKFRTLMVAPTNADTPLKTRVDIADKAKADFYISVHANALKGIWGPQEGLSVYHYPGSAKSKTAAEIIHKYLSSGTKQKDRGILTANFYVLRETDMPSVLVECAFMDNLKEAQLLLTDAFRQECADEICQGICEYFGMAYVPSKELTIQEVLEYAKGKILTDEPKWLKKAMLDKEIYSLLLNFKNYDEKGGMAK